MAAFKSVNLPRKDSDPDFIHKIVSWNQADVDKYLIENGILGCGPTLAANSIDGKAFLGLNYQSLSSWEIPIIKRSKIVALLNDLGPESYRQDAIVKAQISLRLEHAISSIQISQKPKVNSSAKNLSPSTTIKPNLPRFLPIIPPKPQGLGLNRVSHLIKKKPIPPTRNFQNAGVNIGVTARPEKIFVQNSGNGNSANENSVNNDEPEYLVPISDGADLDKKVFVEAVNDCVSCINSAERRFPSLVISSDSFTETDDEGHDGSSAKNVTPSPKKKKKVRKPGFIRNLLLSSKTNLLEEKVTQDPFGTPPLPPARNQNSSRCSSESNISQSGSESQQTPPPQSLTHRKISSQSATSMSSLAETLPPPSYPPPPVPTTPRRMTPRESSPFFGSQTLPSPSPPKSSKETPKSSQGSSPVHSPRSSNSSSHAETPGYPWFFNADRKRAESLLKNAKDGTFLIRPSKHGGESASFTLSLQYNRRVFHVLIGQRPDGKLALGSEKNDENTFYTLNELVEFHFDEAMQLHTNHQLAGLTRLTDWPENIT